MRWVFLLASLAMAVLVIPLVLREDGAGWQFRALAILGLFCLCWWWVHGYERGGFPPAWAVPEGIVIFTTALAVGFPPLSLGLVFVSLMFRSLYGTRRAVVALLLLYLAAFYGAVALATPLAGIEIPAGMLLEPLIGLPLMSIMLHTLAALVERQEQALPENAPPLGEPEERVGLASADTANGFVSRFTGWGTALVVLAVLLVLAITVSLFDDYAEDHLRAQALLLGIEEAAAEEHLRATHSLREGRVVEADDAVGSGVGEDNRREMAEALEELERTDRAGVEVGRLGEALNAYEASLDEELRLIAAGRIERATTVEEERVDPRFEAVHRIADAAARRQEEAARRVSLVSGLASYGALFLAAVALVAVVLTRQREQARRSEQETLRRSEQRFRSLVQNTSDIIMVVAPNGTAAYVSPAVERALGHKPEDVVGTDVFAPVHPEDSAKVRSIVAEITRRPGLTSWTELRLRHADGSWRYFETHFTNMLHDPAVNGIVGNSRDVTERKRAEAALRENYGILRAVTEGTSDFIYLKDLQGRYAMVNSAAAGLLGRPEGEVLGKRDEDLFPPELARRFVESDERVLASGKTETHEERIPMPDGGMRYLLSVTGVCRDDSGEDIGVFGVSRDVTEFKEAEERLRESEASLVEAQRIAHLGNWEFDRRARRAYWSDEMYRIFGFSPQEFEPTADGFVRMIHPDDLERVRRYASNPHAGSEPDSIEHRIVRPDGEVRFVHNQRRFELDASGETIRVVGTVQDVTERRRAEEQVLFQAHLLGQVQAAVIATDLTGIVTHWNEHAERLYGWSREEALGRNVLDLTIGLERDEVQEAVRGRLETGEPWEGEFAVRRKDGSGFIAQVVGSSILDAEGRVVGVVGVAMDITRRKEAEEDLRKSEARNKAILEAAPDLMFRVSRDGEYLDFRANEDAKLYVPREEIVGKRLVSTMPPDLVEPLLRRIARTLDTGRMQVFEYQLPVAEGVLHFEARLVVSGPEEVLGVVRDVTERKALEDELAHRAFHDALTGLPNRALLVDRIEHALARVESHGESVAVLFLDLDDFKVVNDSLGHEVGDRLLVAVAERLREVLRPEDTLARLGGDEFTVLLEDVEGADEATAVAERISSALQEPFLLEGRELFVSTSIGIALGDSAQDRPGGLLRSADLAMYRAKETGKSGHALFDPVMDRLAFERLRMEGELRRALENDELRVYYQPKVLVETGEICGMEALVRWQHPERGMVPPNEFVPLAEATGLIVPIGRRVLVEACRQAREWQQRYGNRLPVEVSVNLSAVQLKRDDLVDDVSSILEETGIGEGALTLEITESVLLEDVRASAQTLEQLKGLGVRIAIDDFGTGYSALSYLTRLPADVLKIDKSFVTGLWRGSQDAQLISGLVGLARGLNLQVVAEGVETAEQLAQLKEMGCKMAQGFYFSKPLAKEEAEGLLRNMQTAPCPETNGSARPSAVLHD